MNYLEILGTVVGLLYLYWEYQANALLWIAGVVMPAIYLVVYYQAGLYADFGISIYYILASIYGLFCWLRGRKENKALSSHDDSSGKEQEEKDEYHIFHTPQRVIIPLIIIFALIFLLIGWILSSFTDSNVPWADAFTTALSIIAMWMLAKKYIEQWIVWIVADLACTALYAYKGLWFTAGLYLLYSIIAISGYFKWKRLMQ
ncbi:MAG: nicotinamide riboside transporter PnuC [Muribaculaceae bacterium]|nr:nicotinamide riboside transporter PnuC [Muribaculaceae bacterium]